MVLWSALGCEQLQHQAEPKTVCLPISCLETSFPCVWGHCLCCRNPDYLLVGCRRACPSTGAWGLWGLKGREELDRLLTQKQSLLLSSPLQTGWLFQQSAWLSLCDRPDEKYEWTMKKTWGKKDKKFPTKLHLLLRTGWRGNWTKELGQAVTGQRNDAERWPMSSPDVTNWEAASITEQFFLVQCCGSSGPNPH